MEKLRKHIEEVTPLTDGEFEYIKTFFLSKRTRRNQFLISEGDEVKYEYWVTEGIYKVFYLDDNGKEFIVEFAQENTWMSDYSAFFKQRTAQMYIECIEPGSVLCLTFHAREKLSAEFHKMEYFFRSKLTNSYMDLENRIKLLLSNTPRQRYEAFALSHPQLIQKIPKKVIAKYLGTSRETLSRIYTNG